MPTISEELERRRQREQALQGGTFDLSGGNLAQGSGTTGEGPGAASAQLIEGILQEAGADSQQRQLAAAGVSPAALAGNATTAPGIKAAAEKTFSEKSFKEMTGKEKTASILQVLGQALAVYASNDPGAAVQNQIQNLLQERQLMSSRRAKAKERREERAYAQDQFASATQAQRDRDKLLGAQRSNEAKKQRAFDLKRDMNNFLRETGFRHDEAQAEREFDRETQQSFRAEDKADRRQAKISELTFNLATNLASLGENSEGQVDPLSRARRVAAAVVDDDLDSLSSGDKAAVEFMLKKSTAESPQDERVALIDAAAGLVGKKQPVPQTEQLFGADGRPQLDESGQPIYQVVRDPATGRIVPKMDALGNVVQVPMSMEEALAFVSTGMEEHEFFQTRTPDQQQVELAEQNQSIVVNPADIKPEHLLDSGGKIGLISAVVGDAATGEEKRERFELFEEEMKARGYGEFSPEVRKVLESVFNREDKTLEFMQSRSGREVAPDYDEQEEKRKQRMRQFK